MNKKIILAIGVLNLTFCVYAQRNHEINIPPHGAPPSQMDMPPMGPPPEGAPHGMPPMGGPEHLRARVAIEGVHPFNGTENYLVENQHIMVADSNRSAIATFEQAKLKLTGSRIFTTGHTSSQEQSSFYGLNAGVISTDESEISMSNNVIRTEGAGANGIFAYGKSTIYSKNDTIICLNHGGHAAMATGGGILHLTNLYAITYGANSGTLATDRGSGTITLAGGEIIANGPDSPGLYSTGEIRVTDAKVWATGAEVAVIEGANSIVVANSELVCTFPNKWGVMIYQSFSGDAEGIDGKFIMIDGVLRYDNENGPLFFVTNTNADIHLNNVSVQCGSGKLISAIASRWGHRGQNGGRVNLFADRQALTGDIEADEISTLQVKLGNQSALTGGINAQNSAQVASVSVDETSVWTLTKDSYVNQVEAQIEGKEVLNIIGNGHTLYYKISDNKALKGKTYSLRGGGTMVGIE